MATRIVEWKKPYTWGKAIDIDENKVISLRLREENNLIIWDEWDNEIYVDLQLADGVKPLDAFPVWVNVWRVLIADDWDVNGTLVVFKTTSGDNIKLLYWDDWKLYIDNWTGLFKQIYLKWEVDALLQALKDYTDAQLALKQDILIAWEYIEIEDNVISAVIPTMSRFLSIWNASTGQPISFPASVPFTYHTWDYYLVENVDTVNNPPVNYRPDGIEYTGDVSHTLETDLEIADWDVYIYDGSVWLLQENHNKTVAFANIAWDPYDNTNLSTALNAKANTTDVLTKSNTTSYTPSWNYNQATKKYVDDGLSNKQATLVSGTNIKSINNNSLLGSWDLSIAEVPSGWTNGQVLTQTQNGPSWENPTWWGSDIEYVTQAEYNQLTPDPDTHYFIYTSSTPTDRPDITSFYYTSSATTGKVNCHSFCCVPSGEYVYVTDWDWPIYEYYLSDSTLNTLTYVTSKSGIKSRWSYVKEDGTKFYSQTDSSPYLYMAEMSTPYDISTATSTTYTNPSACACEFSPDWVYFYYRYGGDSTVCQDTLSTPRDLSTKSSTRNQSLTNMSWYYWYDIRFSPTGLKMYICGRPSSRVPWARVFQYNLGTAWDISTAVYFWYIELPTSYWGQGFSIWFCNNGTRLFAHTCTNNAGAAWTIVQYDAR